MKMGLVLVLACLSVACVNIRSIFKQSEIKSILIREKDTSLGLDASDYLNITNNEDIKTIIFNINKSVKVSKVKFQIKYNLIVVNKLGNATNLSLGDSYFVVNDNNKFEFYFNSSLLKTIDSTCKSKSEY
jgi:hypothetical protein